MSDLILFGAAHVDEVARLATAAVPGASNPVSWRQSVGGVGANAARAAARLITPTLVAVLGADRTAEKIEAALGEAGVQLRAIRRPGQATGRYSAILTPGGDLHIGLADTGLAESLTVTDVTASLAALPETGWLAADANLGPAALDALARHKAARRFAALSVSPAKAPRLMPHATQIDLLITNRAEAAVLAGQPRTAPLADLAEGLRAAGFTGIVLTDGADPLLIVTADGQHQAVPLPGVTGTVATVNGAGDALAGATLGALANGQPLAEAVKQHGLPAAADVLTARTRAPSLEHF